MRRREFLHAVSAGASLHTARAISHAQPEPAQERLSDFCRRLEPVGRILELPDWRVWGCSPLDGPDGKVHVFFARWPNQTGHEG